MGLGASTTSSAVPGGGFVLTATSHNQTKTTATGSITWRGGSITNTVEEGIHISRPEPGGVISFSNVRLVNNAVNMSCTSGDCFPNRTGRYYGERTTNKRQIGTGAHASSGSGRGTPNPIFLLVNVFDLAGKVMNPQADGVLFSNVSISDSLQRSFVYVATHSRNVLGSGITIRNKEANGCGKGVVMPFQTQSHFATYGGNINLTVSHCILVPPTYYNADFSTPLDLAFEADLLDMTGKHRVRVPTAEWVLESVNNSSIAYTVDDNLYMENNGSHMVLWANRPFPAEGEVRFGVMPANTSVGLNIIFFATMPLRNVTKFANATTIFDLALPPRGGNYPSYHGGKGGRGSILGYSDSYWRAGNGSQPCDRNPNDGKCTANLRKNPGFVIAAQGDDLVLGRAPKNGKAFEIVLRRVGARSTITVDGVTSLDWTDDGCMSAPYKGGYVGLRQMSTTRLGVYTHFDVHGK